MTERDEDDTLLKDAVTLPVAELAAAMATDGRTSASLAQRGAESRAGLATARMPDAA